MDLHIIIVIACVFLASLISLLFIHKFFRGKTFEEMATEKRLLAEKLYGTKSKRAGSNSKRSHGHHATKTNKRKNSNPKSSSNTASATNKIESDVVKEDSDDESLSPVEDIQPPEKIVQEVVVNKRHMKEVKEVKEAKEEAVELAKPQAPKNPPKESKKAKQSKKEAPVAVVKEVVAKIEILPAENAPVVQSKETKQPDEKLAKQVDSPKAQNKQNKVKKKTDANLTAAALKKDSPIPTVNSVMSILTHAEFTRGEIQILIDYLLNKQQDTTANHSEWSDDIVQKLRKKLEEKEKAIEEEQTASAGIQAKLRELRTTLNNERVQHNASVKGYMEEVQSLKSELQNSAQDMNERIEKMKEQYNLLKMQSEHFNPQLLLAQINYLNQFKDNAKRNTFVNQVLEILQPQNEELTQLKNENLALRNEILHLNNQNNSLMISFKEAENNLICQKNEVDEEKANAQIQINNLQSALDSAKSELMQIGNNNNNLQAALDQAKSELMLMQTNSQNHVHNLTAQIEDLNRQYMEQASESQDLRNILSKINTSVQEKDQQIAEYEANIRNLISKEDMLMKQLLEQKEKNNDLRKKNWKLVEALQKAETKVLSKNFNNVVQQVPITTTSHNQEDRLRDLLQRLFPEAVSSSSGSALSLPFDQWVEQVISTHINEIVKKHQAELKKHTEQLKQQLELNNVSKSTNDHHNTSSNHTEELNNHKEHRNNGSSDDVILENAQLRAQVAELKSVAINTENTLKNLEMQAQEQESKWRTVVKLKQEEIDMLKNLNRQAV